MQWRKNSFYVWWIGFGVGYCKDFNVSSKLSNIVIKKSRWSYTTTESSRSFSRCYVCACAANQITVFSTISHNSLVVRPTAHFSGPIQDISVLYEREDYNKCNTHLGRMTSGTETRSKNCNVSWNHYRTIALSAVQCWYFPF